MKLQTEPEETMSPIVVAAMYQFVTVDKPEVLREPLLALMHENELHGTLLLATEGINGTVAGSRESVESCSTGCVIRSVFPAFPIKSLTVMRCRFCVARSG